MLGLDSIDLTHQRVLIRVDLNVPLKSQTILDDTRIRAVIPTIQQVLQSNASVILLSHLGRPQEGVFSTEFSLQPVAERLAQLLHRPVRLVSDWIDGFSLAPQEVVLCENVRFNVGEEANAPELAKKIAKLGDVFVMDAFATAHRSQASTVGVAEYAKIAVAGPLLLRELQALAQVMDAPKRPLVAIVGGAKVSDKLQILKHLLAKVDTLIVGGGIANTFLKALGHSVGESLYEPNLVGTAQEILQLAKDQSVAVTAPLDVVVAPDRTRSAESKTVDVAHVADHDKIFDVGPKTSDLYQAILQKAETILWNGPLGVFEIPAFGQGTEKLAHTIAESKAFSVAGGGETLAAIEKYGVSQKLSYISTGGGAFLEALEGKVLPAVAVLENRSFLSRSTRSHLDRNV